LTLVDSSVSSPAIDTTFFGDTGFGDVDSYGYATATPAASYYLDGYYWYVDFTTGYAWYDSVGSGDPYQVRCVR
jgi:hypothetical protein